MLMITVAFFLLKRACTCTCALPLREQWLHANKAAAIHVAICTPANYWAGQISFGWSKSRHANSVAAVRLRVAAGSRGSNEREKPHCGKTTQRAPSCGPDALVSFVLFRRDVTQIKWYKFLCRSLVESPQGWFFGCLCYTSLDRTPLQRVHKKGMLAHGQLSLATTL